MPDVDTSIPFDTLVPDDIRWLRSSFLLPPKTINEINIVNRNRSSADEKYVDTTIGGNFAINVPPQFTHIADPRIEGLGVREGPAHRPSPMRGLGRYYSEAIDDNNEIITMRFGTLQFNSLLGFLSRAYSINYAKMARSGVSDESFAYKMGKVIGFVITAPTVPVITAIRLVTKIIHGAAAVGGNLASLIFGTSNIPGSRYAYLKPAMPMYWATVNHMANTLAINMGLLNPATFFDKDKEGNPITEDGQVFARLSAEDANGLPQDSVDGISVNNFNKLLPEFMRDIRAGGVNVRALAGRAEQIRVRRVKELAAQIDDMLTGEPKSKLDALARAYRKNWAMPTVGTNQPVGDDGEVDSYDYLRKITSEEITSEEASERNSDDPSWFTRKVADYFTLETNAGANWVNFRVTGDKAISESFQNQVGEPELATTLKNKAGKAKAVEASTAGGNIAENFVFDVLGGFASRIKDLATQVVESIGGEGFAALLGGAYLDFPNVWQDSTADLPKMEYTMELRATYGNKMSVFMDIYIPLCMILAATLPLSAGKASYVSPFICELYHQGRAQSRMAMVERVTINRGVGNLGWTVDKLPTAIDVSISIVDLTSIIHAPIDNSINSYEDDSGYNNYMAILGAMGVVDQIDYFPRFYRKKALMVQDVANALSPSVWAMNLSDRIPGRQINHTIRHLGNIVDQFL